MRTTAMVSLLSPSKQHQSTPPSHRPTEDESHMQLLVRIVTSGNITNKQRIIVSASDIQQQSHQDDRRALIERWSSQVADE